jgi:hypothetical protein
MNEQFDNEDPEASDNELKSVAITAISVVAGAVIGLASIVIAIFF